MAGAILSGLSSGFDWQNVVQQLVAAQRRDQQPVIQRQNTLTSQQTALGTLKSLLQGLQSSANDLKKGTSDYYTRVTSQGKDSTTNGSNVSSRADGTTPLGDYVFNIIQKATSSQLTGSTVGVPLTDTSKTLSNLNIATRVTFSETNPNDTTQTFGSFTVNGARITVRPTDTLQSVLTAIGTATNGGVTAALVNDRIVLTSNDIGSGVQPISLGSSNDTSNILEALKLYTNTVTPSAPTVQSATNLGSLNPNILISSALDTSTLTGLTNGTGSFTINGKTINFNINDDSVRSVINTINNSGAGVLANYDTGTGKITITNKETGSTGISLNDPNGFLAKLGLTTAAGATISFGQVARFTINGSSTVLTSNSNKLTEAITGIPGLEVNIKDTGTDTVTVKADTSAARTRLNTFISAYNSLNQKISELTKITVNSVNNTVSSAELAQNGEVQAWQTKLRGFLFKGVDTGVSTVSTLFQIGISTTGTDGKIAITDQSELDDALANNPEEVARLFNKSGDGLGNQISDYIETIVKSKGIYDTQVDSITAQQKNLADQLAKMERIVRGDERRLTEGFQRYENQSAIINQQRQVLNAIFR